MNKRQALAVVANWWAGQVNAGEFEEMTGLRENEVSDSDQRRLVWAGKEIERRLRKMGSQEGS